MFGIGVQELLIVLVIALFVFGGKNLPQIGGDMGRAIKNFKKAVNEPESIEVKPSPPSEEPRP
jgi:sec-independent protein translocase protein TatA